MKQNHISKSSSNICSKISVDLSPKNNYNTVYHGQRQKKASNKQGKRSLLNTGANLCNKDLLGGEICTVTRPWNGLAALMRGST